MNKLAYVKYLGTDNDGKYRYLLYFSKNIEIVWGVDWDYDFPRFCEDLTPDESTYDETREILSDKKFCLAQDNPCYSMEFATLGIIALSWIDINTLGEYPEEGRLVLHFGDSEDKCRELLGKHEIEL